MVSKRVFFAFIMAAGLLLLPETVIAKKTKTKTPSKPKTSVEAKKKQEDTKKEIKLTEAQIKENDLKVSQNLTELGQTREEISKLEKDIASTNREISNLNSEISSIEHNISKNERELSRLREEYLKAVKKMRAARKNKSTLAFIFSSKSWNQAMRRMRYLKEFSRWRANQTEAINAKVKILNTEKETLALSKAEREKMLAQQKNNEENLKLRLTRQESLISELKANGKALEVHLNRKKAEARDLGNTITQLIAQEDAARKKAEAEAQARKKAEELKKAQEEEAKRKKAQEEALLAQQNKKKDDNPSNKKSDNSKAEKKNPSQKSTEYADARKRRPRSNTSNPPAESTQETANDFASMKGKLPAPTTGSFSIVSPFGRQHLPDLPDVEYENPGIDALSDSGASARAVFEGKVSGVYLLQGYNTVVIVNHGNYYTVYGNISTPSVKLGDTVSAGSILGALSANEENAPKTNIHFEVWKNREKQNPQEWLR